jgi:monoamine oxidase
MNRRNFLQAFGAFAGFSSLAASCKGPKAIKGKIVGASAQIGHLLRDHTVALPAETIKKDVVIIGGGVSGLSAARALHKAGITDFTLLDLEQHVGGNAVYGINAVSSYPWGAHYVPIPNNTLTDYIEFLKEAGAITGTDTAGLPIYNEYYLCFDPQERLYINGRWQEGLVPHFGVPDADKKEIERFLKLMESFRYAIGKDGKEAFALPVNRSSKDELFVQLDDITMKQWLQQHGLSSSYLHWYINYCTRDDLGTPYHLASAWAGIHYFACRKGEGANATHSDVLTWPEGNGWLVQQLQRNIKSNVQTGSMAISVKLVDESVTVHYFDVGIKQFKAISAKQCILAVPQFIAGRLLADMQRMATVHEHLHYFLL